MAHKVYDNFYLSNEIEDQFNSHLDLQQFCTVDNSLVGTAGMKRKINVYKATAGTEKLKMGEGNSKAIEVSFTPEEYEIQLAQNKFTFPCHLLREAMDRCCYRLAMAYRLAQMC